MKHYKMFAARVFLQHLSRREWRGYRLQLMQWAGVKKCVRNFFTFCDANDDYRLNETEWISCVHGVLADIVFKKIIFCLKNVLQV
jgi:hypothetical protein